MRAEVAGSRARADVALAGYEQTVLRALQETEDALVTHARTRESLADASDAAEASRTAAHIARTRYEGGMVDFLDVLDAERTQLEAESRLAQSRTDAATSLIALYKALGGGWELGAPAALCAAGGGLRPWPGVAQPRRWGPAGPHRPPRTPRRPPWRSPIR